MASPHDNFLLLGANCKEDHLIVKQFTQQLASKIEEIEKKTYTVSDNQVTFTFELISSDMKFLAFLNGGNKQCCYLLFQFCKCIKRGLYYTEWQIWANKRLQVKAMVLQRDSELPNRLKDLKHNCPLTVQPHQKGQKSLTSSPAKNQGKNFSH